MKTKLTLAQRVELAARQRITHRPLNNAERETETMIDGKHFGIFATPGQGERAALNWIFKPQIDALVERLAA